MFCRGSGPRDGFGESESERLRDKEREGQREERRRVFELPDAVSGRAAASDRCVYLRLFYPRTQKTFQTSLDSPAVRCHCDVESNVEVLHFRADDEVGYPVSPGTSWARESWKRG